MLANTAFEILLPNYVLDENRFIQFQLEAANTTLVYWWTWAERPLSV